MPAIRYVHVPVPMDKENAKRAAEALDFVKEQLKEEAAERNAEAGNLARVTEHPEPGGQIAGLVDTFSQALDGCDCSRGDTPLAYLEFYALDRKEPALVIETVNEGWVENDALTRIIQACQTELNAGPAGWIYYDNIYGEEDNGAMFVAPGEKPLETTLGQWLSEQAVLALERRAHRTPKPESGEHFILLPKDQVAAVREALAIVDREDTDWARGCTAPEYLTFESAFPHVGRENPPDDQVWALSLAILKAVAETIEDPTDTAALGATPPLSRVTTAIGHQGLYILSSPKSGDPAERERAFRTSRVVNEAVREFFGCDLPGPSAAPEEVEPNDRVWDPMENRWRTVVRVDREEQQAFLSDGGVIGLEEIRHVLLPSEHEYDPRVAQSRPAAAATEAAPEAGL